MLELTNIMKTAPCAKAEIKGSVDYPCIKGEIRFYHTHEGILVYSEVNGLPKDCGKCEEDIFAFHIHEEKCCSGNEEDLFADAGAHYNPQDCKHPFHAGDMPPLWGNGGYAFSAFVTDRFKISEIIGKTVIIHAMPDDFMTQPSGNSGKKIACGEIKRCCCR